VTRQAWLWSIRVGAGLLAGSVLLAGSASIVGSFFVSRATSTKVIDQPVHALNVTGTAGDVVIRTGAVGSRVIVTSKLRNAFRHARHSETVTGDVLTLSSTCTGGPLIADTCAVRTEITLPPGITITVRNTNGDTTVTADGPITVTSTNGDIDVAGGRAAIRIRTTNGDLRGRGLRAGSISAQSSNGDVDLRFAAPPGSVSAVSRVGDVRVRVPGDGTAYRVTAQAKVGSRSVDVPNTPTAGRSIHAASSVGDVTIEQQR
jgi:hypothetical protein